MPLAYIGVSHNRGATIIVVGTLTLSFGALVEGRSWADACENYAKGTSFHNLETCFTDPESINIWNLRIGHSLDSLRARIKHFCVTDGLWRFQVVCNLERVQNTWENWHSHAILTYSSCSKSTLVCHVARD